MEAKAKQLIDPMAGAVTEVYSVTCALFVAGGLAVLENRRDLLRREDMLWWSAKSLLREGLGCREDVLLSRADRPFLFSSGDFL